MGTHRRKWSTSEKLAALEMAEAEGFAAASRKLNISQTSLHKWKNLQRAFGNGGLAAKVNGANGVPAAEAGRLARENQQLKQLVAEKELELMIHKELLKKNT